MDRILKRQLKKIGLDENSLPDESAWEKLLSVISESYNNSEKERSLLEHSIEVNSEEMLLLHEKLEEKVKTKTTELNDIAHSQKIVLETLADGVVMISTKGLIEAFNPAAEAIFGFKEDEVLGKNVSILMPKEDRGGHQSYVDKTSIRGASKIFHRRRELLGLRKDGSHFPLEINVSPLKERKGGFVGILRDVTERRLHENELLDALEAAEESSKAKSLFLASMSHELRTPLNAILGFAELFEYAPNLDDKFKRNAEEILTAGSHLLDLINEILDMSRIESGSVELSLEKIIVKELFDECLSFSKALADKRNISIEWSGDTNFVLNTDYTRAKQVLLNLISNGIKYNKLEGKVTVRCQQQRHGLLLLEVEDTGKGIEPSKLDGLFEPFNRLGEENSNIEGTGLGLAITKKLVEVMGGNIGVSSELDKGSCFWATLPGETMEELVLENDDNSFNTPIVDKNINKPTILYIEDNPSNQRLVAQICEHENTYNFICADNAEAGIELALENKPEIILMDIDLPGIDGVEALIRLKKYPTTKLTPIIAISATIDRTLSRNLRNQEFFSLLSKPINRIKLLQVFEDAMVQVNKQSNSTAESG